MNKLLRPPHNLYRFRPLDKILVERELEALTNSYLYAAPFSTMNDPMEAFYQLGTAEDLIVENILSRTNKSITDVHDMYSSMVDKFALVSFSTTYRNLPMWAYYASNFEGMCLEFDPQYLSIGDFQNEILSKVTYAKEALPNLSFADITNQEAIVSRITRKRSEWSHEAEWRFITGEIGKKHYPDNSLKRILLGPKVNKEHEDKICELFQNRPTEVMKGRIDGFSLYFDIVKPAQKISQCVRIGKGEFRREDIENNSQALKTFLDVPYEALIEKCNEISQLPNIEEIYNIDISYNNPEQLYIQVAFKMRNTREVYHKYYFDNKLNEITPT